LWRLASVKNNLSHAIRATGIASLAKYVRQSRNAAQPKRAHNSRRNAAILHRVNRARHVTKC